MLKQGFIFHDERGSRWPRFKLLATLGILLTIAGLSLFIFSLFVAPFIDQPDSFKGIKSKIRSHDQSLKLPREHQVDRVLQRMLEKNHLAAIAKPSSGAPEIRSAFFYGWDEAAFRSLEKHKELLTHLCPEYLSFTDAEDGITEDADSNLDRVSEMATMKLMPVLSNLDGSNRIPGGVEYLSQAGAAEKKEFIIDLLNRLKNVNASGVVIDWEEVDSGSDNELSSFVAEIATDLKAEGLETWLCITMDASFSNWDFEKLAPHVGRFIAFLHDENGVTDKPGPIASNDWVDGWLKVINSCSKPEQWIASLGCHGMDWVVGSTEAEEISFPDAMSRAGNSGCQDLRFTDPEKNATFSYFYDNKEHEVWFLDATSFANHWNSARDYGFAGLMLSRMGGEDPSVWQVIAQEGPTTASDFSDNIPSVDAITSIGRGEVVSLDPTTTGGHRQFSDAPDGTISCKYLAPPAYPTLFRLSATSPDRVTITFDDGPDPDWTPGILDILKERGVKALFFIVGQEAELYPDLVRRIVAEGHEIGNHSFTHPNLAETPTSIIRLELNATQRLIESLTGVSTTLFRPPYNADSHPSKLEELVPIGVAQSLGYMTILEKIDPRDWQDIDKEELLSRVKRERPKGNIILLHDGGGDRSATLEALPAILDYLQERGDQVVSLSQLLDLDPHKIMPPMTDEKETLHLFTSGMGFQILRVFQSLLHWFIVISTTLVVARTILVILLARLHKAPDVASKGYLPAVSVIIPAYNEQKVIAKTIQSLLASQYEGPVEVIVIDDGSTDGTLEAVEALNDPRLRVVKQSNSGKAYALQRGVDETTNEILIFADADTQFDRHAIALLAGTFEDSQIGAVSGHARVGNRSTFLARCQDLEYICGFNLDRRAYATWNCITVAPGAISAIRRTTIIAAGGFSYETLAEDTDLTLAIHKTGYRVEYQPKAIAYTEAPETFSALASQRFRWAYGTLQCVFKHADILFNPRYKALGFLSLPGILFFQIVLVAFSPAIDLLFIESMFMGRVGDILPYFLAFILCDLVVAAVALHMEGLPKIQALRIIPQRFLYRPLLGYVVWKALFHAMRGAWVGWGKLQRSASVSIP